MPKLYKKILIIAVIAVIIAAGAVYFFYSPDQNLRVNFLDVGQGDSVLIQTPYGQNILIDGGDSDAKILQQLPIFMPFWDRQIDLMILTHPHDDHVGGLVKVAERYDVKKILYTGVVHNSPAYLAWLEAAREKSIPVVIIDRPQIITLGEKAQIKILYPFASLLNQEVDNLNNSSIAAKLIYDEVSFLLAGDIEQETEQALADEKINLEADIMKASHHGSITSNTEKFLAAVSPEAAVIQVGADNDFGHPSPRVLKRLARQGITVYRNDLDGWVQIISDGKIFNISLEKSK